MPWGSILSGIISSIPWKSIGKGLLTAGTETIKVTMSALQLFQRQVSNITATLEKFSQTVQKVQESLGVNISTAGRIQLEAVKSSVQDSFKALQDLFSDEEGMSAITDMFSVVTDTFKSAAISSVGDTFEGNVQNVVGNIFSGFNTVIQKLEETASKPRPQATVAPTAQDFARSRIEMQKEFGVIPVKEVSDAYARYAKTYGVSIENLIKGRRVFSTILMGDLKQVDTLRDKMLDAFKAQNISRNIALEEIVKYSEIFARNGMRFANSFVRAAADAKKIGVDLNKVEQIGDNIIGNFEGFLESQAELGAMGFGFDTSRLAELAETGDTGALFNELRSQLAATGKDITKLSRSERLALESGLGINISDMLKLAGVTPEEKTSEDLLENNNTLLGKILAALEASKVIFTLVNFALSVAIATYLMKILNILLELAGKPTPTEEDKRAAYERERDNMLNAARTGAPYKDAQISIDTLRGFNPKTGKFETTEFPRYNVDALGRRIGPDGKPVEYEPTGAPGDWETMKNDYKRFFNFMFKEKPDTLEKSSGGIIRGPGSGTSDSIPARLSDGEYVVKASAVKRPGVKELLDKINYGNESVLMKAQGGFISKLMSRIPDTKKMLSTSELGLREKGSQLLSKVTGRLPGVSTAQNLYSSYKESGIRGLGSQLFGQFGKRIPGVSNVMDTFSAFKQGGVKGALGSLARGGIGKMIGGAIGSAIPIPGVGTAIGSLMGSKVGKLVGGLFGRRKKPVGEQLMGALPDMAGFAGNLMGRIPGMERFNPEGLMRGMAERPQAQAAVQTVVDTTGIEQKLNNFVNALNNMNIVMDGAKVGKVLVNVTDAANTVGVFRPATRATL